MGSGSGKTALVTGGASGLGRAIAKRLASDGAQVVISDIREDLGLATASQLGVEFLQQDVREETRWNGVIREVQDRFGQLNILVNNAGVIGHGEHSDPESTALESWQYIFSINVEGVFLGCRAAIAAMRKAGAGSIVNLSSIAGILATPQATAYGASKAAVWHLTRSVAQYCAERKLAIRCNAVHPGVIRTPLWERHVAELAHGRGIQTNIVVSEAQASIPLGDFTLAEDVAAAVSFLISDEARHVTGTKLVVDGGIIGCDTYGR